MNPKRLYYQKSNSKVSGDYVLYWMQQSQRVYYNDALNFAIELANEKKLPLIVFFNVYDQYFHANLRHFEFMFEGLDDMKKSFKKENINFIITYGYFNDSLNDYIGNADSLVMDMGYLKHQKDMRNLAIKTFSNINIFIIETDVVVPVKETSNKLEYSAKTIRNKINSQIHNYLNTDKLVNLNNKTKLINTEVDLDLLKSKLNVDTRIKKSKYFKGGYFEAKLKLNNFLKYKLGNYHLSNNPSTKYTSNLSMYLHFGQLSVVEIIYEINKYKNINSQIDENIKSFLEQLIVRRELAVNYVFYNENYLDFNYITYDWAYKTMLLHLNDKREYIYTVDDYIHFKTHDEYFNAAMKEMIYTGYMHNYMRMYWAKKIIEWSNNYEDAFNIIVYLNDKYFIDGRDPISYTSIAWCFGRHDRAWSEREIFGKLRYMNSNGLKRKFNMDEYINYCSELGD